MDHAYHLRSGSSEGIGSDVGVCDGVVGLAVVGLAVDSSAAEYDINSIEKDFEHADRFEGGSSGCQDDYKAQHC